MKPINIERIKIISAKIDEDLRMEEEYLGVKMEVGEMRLSSWNYICGMQEISNNNDHDGICISSSARNVLMSKLFLFKSNNKKTTSTLISYIPQI